ncbi:hypothetical protein [Wolbachia endosymbiont of Ctenocephalides felis wCfeT]|uniref:hypothetical protein n=1 Tax=Wolbachia endosymbiont of Ctenocephalides felis wCfeT TaxID=2732593 RepID=UPI0014475738|nr:hypothetical protein [Wolbachia endosymbiont of Ctenocephalides felis wCfeT]
MREFLRSILDTQQEEGFEKYLEKKKERGEVQAQHILKRYCYLYVKKLNKLIKDKIKEFREEFNKLSDYQKERYISLTVENEHAKAMCYILDEMDEDEAIKTFKELFDHYEKFASDTLYTAADRKLPLWRTLLNNLDTQQKKVCKKYSEKKNTKGAKKILKHLSQNNKSSKEMPNNVIVEELNELVSGSQKDKFQEKFKKLPRELKDHYYNKTVESKNVKTMSYILETKGYKILSNLLHNNNKEFTFDALYRVSLKSTVSKTLLTQLDIQQKEGFRKYLEEKIKKGIIGAKSILEHYFYPSDKNSKVNKDFEKLNKLANASKTTKHKEEFTKEFNMLNNNDQMKYIDLTVANQRVTAMFYILNASAESFISVFQSDKEFACNVLNAVADNSSTLFTELLGKLDSQQNKDYVEYLHEKFTKGILKNRRALKYYLNNKSNLEEPLEKEEALPQPKGTLLAVILSWTLVYLAHR